MSIETALSIWTPRIQSVLRIMAGLLLLQHGTVKILGFPHVEQFANVPINSSRGRRFDRIGRRYIFHSRPIHAINRFHSIGDDRCRVLLCPRSQKLLSNP
jgi:hypothetical protein